MKGIIPDHLEVGKKGEDLASEYLTGKGYIILERNWTFEKAELDIIAIKEGLLVFVEVKTRRSDFYGDPEDAVTPAKIKNILNAAEAYIEEKDMDNEIRFDIISIIMKGEITEITHLEDAIYPFDE
jgi:putative endonuclease